MARVKEDEALAVIGVVALAAVGQRFLIDASPLLRVVALEVVRLLDEINGTDEPGSTDCQSRPGTDRPPMGTRKYRLVGSRGERALRQERYSGMMGRALDGRDGRGRGAGSRRRRRGRRSWRRPTHLGGRQENANWQSR